MEIEIKRIYIYIYIYIYVCMYFILYYITLYFILIYYNILYYIIILYYVISYYIILYHIMLCFIILYHIILYVTPKQHRVLVGLCPGAKSCGPPSGSLIPMEMAWSLKMNSPRFLRLSGSALPCFLHFFGSREFHGHLYTFLGFVDDSDNYSIIQGKIASLNRFFMENW